MIAGIERDDDLRAACFLALNSLRREFGEDLPSKSGLDRGFPFQGRNVRFMTRAKGIHRSALQRGPAALSITTSFKRPYDDERVADELVSYAYQRGDLNRPDNRALDAAWASHVPLVYFEATRPWMYRAVYPCFVTNNLRSERRVVVTVGQFANRSATLPDTTVDRVYAVREAKQRLHQGRFRGMVLPAYHDQCAICRLKEPRLLDAAHIIRDADPEGVAAVQNGLSLCTIHHSAFDRNLVGVTPDYRVKVARRLLDDDDGPMLDLLKGFHDQTIVLPSERRRPDRDRLAVRFDEFRAAAAA